MKQARWRRSGALAASAIEEELVLLDAATGEYFGLNRVAVALWELLAEPRTADELVVALCARYEVSEEDCSRDVRALLESLREHGLAEERAAP
ncbi:MAG: PqqD family protein [Sorangiineae bacterium]|nr:PqqD family protein [Polyangiaceae bacterium]MEB2324014.1 PqqD family protein [Sorangiineae bacterium]